MPQTFGLILDMWLARKAVFYRNTKEHRQKGAKTFSALRAAMFIERTFKNKWKTVVYEKFSALRAAESFGP